MLSASLPRWHLTALEEQ